MFSGGLAGCSNRGAEQEGDDSDITLPRPTEAIDLRQEDAKEEEAKEFVDEDSPIGTEEEDIEEEEEDEEGDTEGPLNLMMVKDHTEGVVKSNDAEDPEDAAGPEPGGGGRDAASERGDAEAEAMAPENVDGEEEEEAEAELMEEEDEEEEELGKSDDECERQERDYKGMKQS